MYFDNAIYEAGLAGDVDNALIAMQDLIAKAIDIGTTNFDLSTHDGLISDLETQKYFQTLDLHYRIGARRANEISKSDNFDLDAFQRYLLLNYPNIHGAIDWFFKLTDDKSSQKPTTYISIVEDNEDELATCPPPEEIEL